MATSRGRKARRYRERVMRAAGVEVVERVFLDAAADVPAEKLVDAIAWETGVAIKRLALAGADMRGDLAITIGAHPSYPGSITIEAKAAKKAHADDCPGCPLDHSLDSLDDD